MPLGLTPAEVLSINHRIADMHGLRPMAPRDEILLELVCARACLPGPLEVFDRVGLLVEGLLNARPLGNCHHATTLAAMVAALELGKHRLACSPSVLAREMDGWVHPVDAEAVARWLRLAAEPVA